MTLPTAAHTQRGIHMHIMAREVQAYQPLKHDTPAWPRAREEDKQARRRAPVRHHVQYSAERRALVEMAGGDPVKRIEEAGNRVEDGAGARVQGHVVEGGDGEDHARVACGGVEWSVWFHS